VTTAIRTTTDHTASRACYLRGCREPGCADANRRWCKRYRLDRYTNGPRRADATEARAVVASYIDAGWSYSAIAELAKCSESLIFDLANGAIRISALSAQLLAAIPATPDRPRGHAYAGATGTIRRARALVRIGHQVGDIAAALRQHPDTLSRTINRDHGLVLVTTARAMAALYEQWRWKPGPSERSRQRAARAGWHGPLAWDDNIDDPAAVPDTEGAGYDGRPRKRDPQRPKEIRHLAGFGYSAYTIGRQVGLPEKDVKERLDKIRAEKAAAQEAAA
jgi:hypothetical protein